MTDDNDWKFLTALGGVANAEIVNHTIEIQTTDEGTVDYSVQLVQADIPLETGATYEVSFEAYADANRTMKTCITAPDFGFSRYFEDTIVELSTNKTTYVYSFVMKDSSDANGRLEFNLGAAGTNATVWITNLIIKKTAEPQEGIIEEKTILADGNYVYNGGFQEGKNRLGYWEIMNECNAEISVTNIATKRRLQVVVVNNDMLDNVDRKSVV